VLSPRWTSTGRPNPSRVVIVTPLGAYSVCVNGTEVPYE
jgi:hypothetical protein